MISDVFENLVSNAIKYGRPGGVIRIDVRDGGDRWRVEVADTGDGIADADKEKLFTRFERLRKEGVKGTGLGLAIAKRIVDLHGGSIWVEDNPGGGAVFCVALPKACP
jgi:signal transduction histidine kinase